MSSDKKRFSRSPGGLAGEVLSGAAGAVQVLEREGRVQLRDLSRRLSRRLELVEGEEFAALAEQVRDLDRRLSAVEARLAGAGAKKTAKKAVKGRARKSPAKKASGGKSAKKVSKTKKVSKKRGGKK